MIPESSNSYTDPGRPLRVLFLLSSMPVGGAETLLQNMVRKIDLSRIAPMIGCMKQKDALGEVLENELPVYDQLINHKYDVAVVNRLKTLFREQQIDALITVGAGDKMFWGRLAAWRAKVPVILSALHSTGWPDGVGRLNRMLTRITDGFIAVARDHARYQIEQEGFPKEKVFMIPNGIDVDRFRFDASARTAWRRLTGISAEAPVVGIVAALRPEKNHDQFLEAAKTVLKNHKDAHFVIAGDGPERQRLEALANQLNISRHVHFLGSVDDIPGVLSMLDVFSLTSHNEASPVSILEALSCRRPVVAPDVGSIHESVLEGETGFLVPAGDAKATAAKWMSLIEDSVLRERLGAAGRQHVVESGSLESMTAGYVELVESIFRRKKNPQHVNIGAIPVAAVVSPCSNP